MNPKTPQPTDDPATPPTAAAAAHHPAARDRSPCIQPPRQLSRVDLADALAELDNAALDYDARRHGGLRAIDSYTAADGRTHQVCVNYHPVAACWRIIDVAADGSAVLVERMAGSGAEETRGPAVSHAADYAREWQRYAAGKRDSPPTGALPRMTMTYKRG